jgi:NADPH:quinone reductase-like Zn-dependent oxidoreductase
MTSDLTATGPQVADWPELPAAVPRTMTAVTFREFGGPEVLKPEQLPVPVPGAGEVLVRVAAVSVGRLLDLVARSGKHPYASFTFSHVLGAEHAGVVAARGTGVTNLTVGDRVAVFPVVVEGEDDLTRAGFSELSPLVQLIGTHRQGAYAEYTAVPASNVTKVPSGIDPLEVVAVALAGAVANNQFDRAGGIGPGSRVIVQGATSALGSTTALLAKFLGAQVIVSSRYADKREKLRSLGFEHVLDGVEPRFVDEVRAIFGPGGAHVIVDNLGSPMVWEHGMQVLARGGTVVSSGAFLGHQVPLNLQRLYSLGQRIVGVRTGNLASAAKLWQQVDNGFRSVCDTAFLLEEAPLAHEYVEHGDNVGRVSLIVP